MIQKDKKDKTGQSVFKDTTTDEPPRKRSKTDDDDEVASGSTLADISKRKATTVGTVTPVDDFREIVRRKDCDMFEKGCTMMQKRIEQLINDSFGTQFYPKAMECVQALRTESIKKGDPHSFNTYLLHLKKSTLAHGGRKDFWALVMSEKVSLISKAESEHSKVTLKEAEALLEEAEDKDEQKPAAQDDDEDEDDLLDQM